MKQDQNPSVTLLRLDSSGSLAALRTRLPRGPWRHDAFLLLDIFCQIFSFLLFNSCVVVPFSRLTLLPLPLCSNLLHFRLKRWSGLRGYQTAADQQSPRRRELLTHLKLFFISRSLAMTSTGSV